MLTRWLTAILLLATLCTSNGCGGGAASPTTTPPVTIPLAAYCMESMYGPCGDPYEGQGAPPNQQPITACNSSISTGGNYIVTQNIGSDATQVCLRVNNPSSLVNLDLGGHAVTGSVVVASNVGENVVMNGVINCNISNDTCLNMGTTGRLHHLAVGNLSSTPGSNINLTGTSPASTASPVIRVDHVATTVGYAPNVSRTRNIMDDGASGSPANVISMPLEADYNYITCSDNASACQGVELYGAPYSSVHDNLFDLPSDCSLCTDAADAVIFDQLSYNGEFASNDVTVYGNRAARVRFSQSILIHDNVFRQITTPGRLAAVQVGENGSSLDDDFVAIYNNTFQLGAGGNGVVSAAATDVSVYNNTLTCVTGNCAGAGFFALTQVPASTYAQTGTALSLRNNNVSALPAGTAAVMVCGPGTSPYECVGSSAATSSAAVCNSGTAVGNGTIDPSCPFSDGFESGDFSKWDAQNHPEDQAVVTSPVHSGTYSAQFYYNYTNTDGGKDLNVWASKVFPAANNLHIRFYIYFKSPNPGETSGIVVQRKLFYTSDSTSPTNELGNYQIILDAWNYDGAQVDPNHVYLSWGSQGTGGGCGIPSAARYALATLNYNTWYSVEIEFKLNTPGGSDGEVHLWINGSNVYNSTGISDLRGTCTGNLSWLGIGNQANITVPGTVDEDRYWDDVVVSPSYVGP